MVGRSFHEEPADLDDWKTNLDLFDLVWCRNGAVLALLLPGIATRRGVARRARRQVKRGHRDCTGGNFSARASYLAPLGRGITDLLRRCRAGLRVGRRLFTESLMVNRAESRRT